MPEGRTWGATSAVDIDKDGRSIWVGERCGANSCLNSELPSVLKFDPSGKLVASFGAGLMIFPHGIHVDRAGNIWMTDGQDNKPRAARGAPADAPLPPAPAKLVGHQVFKFSPEGKLLLTLGNAGRRNRRDRLLPAERRRDRLERRHLRRRRPRRRERAHHRVRPERQVSARVREEGHRPRRVRPAARAGLRFQGAALCRRIEATTASRSSTKDGKFIEEFRQFSRPSGIYIDRNDIIYVADSESGSVGNGRERTEKRGIRIGSLKDGKVIALIPDPTENATNTSAAEGVAVDAAGNIYGAEVGPAGAQEVRQIAHVDHSSAHRRR